MWFLEYTHYDAINKCYVTWSVGLGVNSVRKITEAKRKAEEFLINNPHHYLERQCFNLCWIKPLESSVPQCIFKKNLVID